MAVVVEVRDAIVIVIDVAGIAGCVAVGIELVGIGVGLTVVAEVADAVGIIIRLIGIGQARTIVITVCGIAAGARKIMSCLLNLIEEKGIKDIIVANSGCAGLCSREPMITVEQKEKSPVKYVDLNEEKVETIFQEHLLNGKIVKEYALAMGSEQLL